MWRANNRQQRFVAPLFTVLARRDFLIVGDMPQFVPMPCDLETERLRLRQLREDDSQTVRELWLERDPRVPRRIDRFGRPSIEDIQERIAAQLAESTRSGLSLLAIEEKSNPGLLGYCGLTVGAGSDTEPEIAFELFRTHQGCGFATEAASSVVDAAQATGRSRLWATVREWNVASFKVLAKLDFADSGRRTEDSVHGNTFWMLRDL
ncbi:RimJ/RimL family protein N-acetyltransferase [Arthrobacter sp. CAN_A6]